MGVPTRGSTSSRLKFANVLLRRKTTVSGPRAVHAPENLSVFAADGRSHIRCLHDARFADKTHPLPASNYGFTEVLDTGGYAHRAVQP